MSDRDTPSPWDYDYPEDDPNLAVRPGTVEDLVRVANLPVDKNFVDAPCDQDDGN